MHELQHHKGIEPTEKSLFKAVKSFTIPGNFQNAIIKEVATQKIYHHIRHLSAKGYQFRLCDVKLRNTLKELSQVFKRLQIVSVVSCIRVFEKGINRLSLFQKGLDLMGAAMDIRWLNSIQ